MKYKFKAVSQLPDYINSPGKYRNFIEEFMKSEIGIADISEEHKNFGVSKAGFFAGLKYEILRMQIRNLVFVTTRHKKQFIVNIKKSGIKSMRGNRKVKAIGRAERNIAGLEK